MEDKFTVEPNRCDCHPETCACNPWNVMRNGVTKFVSCFSRGRAEQIARALNGSAVLTGHTDSAKARKD